MDGYIEPTITVEKRSDTTLLHVAHAAVGYNGKAIIPDVELVLEPGQIMTLIGPNGSGKSTILKSVIRQLDLIGGAVYLSGEEMARLSQHEIATQLSILMTERVDPELMTCEDVVSTGRHPYTGRLGVLSDHDYEIVHDCLEMVHALDLAERPFAEISDGQRQRILLARALCQEPAVMVLDEPTSYLDIRHKLELLTILKRMVAERDLAVLMSLHELDLAQRVSDVVVCVHNGAIERVGTPDEVFTDAYIAELYDLSAGRYDALFGSLEMEAPTGDPHVFVIGGAGRGIATYRALQRAGIAFIAGIIHENDLDRPVAASLAAEVISERAFEPISDAAFEAACAAMERCDQVVCCLEEEDLGLLNERDWELAERARAAGKLMSRDDVVAAAERARMLTGGTL